MNCITEGPIQKVQWNKMKDVCACWCTKAKSKKKKTIMSVTVVVMCPKVKGKKKKKQTLVALRYFSLSGKLACVTSRSVWMMNCLSQSKMCSRSWKGIKESSHVSSKVASFFFFHRELLLWKKKKQDSSQLKKADVSFSIIAVVVWDRVVPYPCIRCMLLQAQRAYLHRMKVCVF